MLTRINTVHVTCVVHPLHPPPGLQCLQGCNVLDISNLLYVWGVDIYSDYWGSNERRMSKLHCAKECKILQEFAQIAVSRDLSTSGQVHWDI